MCRTTSSLPLRPSKSCGVGGGGPCNYCATPVTIGLGFGFGTDLGLDLDLRGPDLGLRLHNIFYPATLEGSLV